MYNIAQHTYIWMKQNSRKLMRLTNETAAYSRQDGQQQKEEAVVVGQQETN